MLGNRNMLIIGDFNPFFKKNPKQIIFLKLIEDI